MPRAKKDRAASRGTGKHRASVQKKNVFAWVTAVIIILLAGAIIYSRTSRIRPKIIDRQPSAIATNSESVALASPSLELADGLEPTEELEIDVDKSVEALNLGNQLLAQGRMAEAIEQYSLAVKHNPEDEDTHYNLGLALARNGDLDAAVAAYRESLRIYPDYVEAHNNLGNVLVKQGRFAQAVEHFQEAIKHEPDRATTHNNLGNALARQGKVAEAIPHFHLAIQLDPAYSEAQFNLATSYLNLKRFDEAIVEFSAILREKPDFQLAAVALARARQQKAAADRGAPIQR